MLEHLCTPWRWNYIRNENTPANCLFCLRDEVQPAEIIAESEHVYVVLNRYPYNTGHIMVVPYRHVSTIELFTEEEQIDFIQVVQKALKSIQKAYEPEGINMGANIGKVAGAGIAAHFHLHLVPRWAGDTSFMTVTAAARVLPESLPDTAEKLRAIWQNL